MKRDNQRTAGPPEEVSILTNIEAERARRNLSKRKCAALLNISPQTYSAYIYRKRAIPTDVLLRMADIFGCCTDYLLDLTSDPRKF